MESNDLVSIIMPAYNAEKYIAEAIESALKQTYPNFELIVVDDGSKDKTAEVVKTFKDKRIRLIMHPQNMGVSEARNTALANVEGKWIALLDSDDKWLPERLEVLLGILSQHNYGDCFIADDILISFNKQGKLVPYGTGLEKWAPKLKNKIIHNGGMAVIGMKDFLFLVTTAFHPILPTVAIKNNHLQFSTELNYAEDSYFYAKLLNLGLNLIFIKEAYYVYRLTAVSLTDLNLENYLLKFNKYEEIVSADKDFSEENKELFKQYFEYDEKEFNYKEFAYSLKTKEYAHAFKLALLNPTLIIKLLIRLPKSMRYRISVKIRGGTTRNLLI